MLKYTFENDYLPNYKDTLLSTVLINVYQNDLLSGKQLE